MTDRVGRVLGGRYRLLALIGSGASAQVYLADDVRLGRQVAVKMLHPMLVDDVGFYRRFESEARRAATLSHANVVAVYDWGDDDGPFLVTEYLDGGSLRDTLDAGQRLSPSQALMVGLEAARGLSHAHSHGLVHRDVKPANLLFSSDGRLRVADFGVARALAEAALTEPSGPVPGTVRYSSPEQARGQAVGPPGDVYALALVLVEAVTGSVPFAADTTIGTLMARTDRPIPVSDELGPLRGPLEHAGRVDPDARPDAPTFAAELLGAAEQLPPPSPLPLAGLTVSLLDDDPTLVPGFTTTLPTPPAPPVDGTTAMGVPPSADPPTVVSGAAPSASPAPAPVKDASAGASPPLFDQELHDAPGGRAAKTGPTEAGGPKTKAKTTKKPKGPRRWPLVVVAVIVAAALAAGGAFLWTESQVPSYEVPSLVGRQESELNELVGSNGWRIEIRDGREDGSVPGQILAQDPAPGTQLEEGETLVVTVSLGATLAAPPTDLVGLTQDEARERIEAAGFTLGSVTESHSEDVAAGIVLSTPPQPEELEKGSPIDLEVSAGPAPRTVPDDLAGRSFDEAAAALGDLGLEAVRADESSDTVAEGQVIRLDPEAGSQVERGSPVTVVMSTGPPMVEIPDLTGRTPSEAADALEGLGLEVAGTRGPPNQNVIGTDPEAGATVRRGTEVTIVTGRNGGNQGPGNDNDD